MAETTSTTPKHHDVLWFTDGNVVLETDTYLFRVHKSLLSFHSTVFRDMFELPTAETWTGVEDTLVGMVRRLTRACRW